MINHLHDYALWTDAVKTARPIAMSARFGLHFNIICLQEPIPGINVTRRFENKANMVQQLCTTVAGMHRPVQRQIVVT